MHIELTTGKDSFRAQGGSQRRNVSVHAHVRVPDDGEGRQIIHMYQAYQRKLKHFKNTTLSNTFPASEHGGPELAGAWYVNRHEVMPGTEILIEYKHRSTTPGSFGEDSEYLMLVADPDFELWNVQLQLPQHHLSAVPFIFFTGNFQIINSHEDLSEQSIVAWSDFLGIEYSGGKQDFYFTDALDPNQEQSFFNFEKLEDKKRKTKRIERVKTTGGDSRIRVRRGRRLKLR